MLNVPLYNALVRLFTDVSVVHEDEQAEFEVPQITNASFLDIAKKTKKVAYAHVTHWGETYNLNCPVCGDSRRRLFICHLLGRKLRRKKTPVLFGDRVYVCHNEHCNIDEYIKQLKIVKSEKIPEGYAKDYVGPKIKPGDARKAVLQQSIDLPEGAISLLGNEVPDYVYAYLLGRGFVPHTQDSQGVADLYHLYFVPEGATYKDGDEIKEFYEDRLLIPIINRNRLISWQARSFKEKAKLKYINAPGIPKSELLYNMDVAWQYKDIIMVEGVTDVWRVGSNSIDPFGKSLSDQQVHIMATLWGHCGRCLIALDKDARGGVNKKTGKKLRDFGMDAKLKLEKAKAFPRGVYLFDLPDERDPADYETNEIRAMLNGVFDELDRKEQAQAQHLEYAQQQIDIELPMIDIVDEEEFE